MRRLLLALVLVVFAARPALAQPPCVWGSFDATRINYPGGPLTGTEHSILRTIITANGGTIGAPTPTLTAAYLAGVQVFYTSLLNINTGTLSAAEQTALQAWIAAGGTLIVTADIFPLGAYDSFTAFYGVTNYVALGNVGVGNVTASHPITAGVTNYQYNTECRYSVPGTALALGNNGFGDVFMIVMETGTGFPFAGRIFETADHNMFTNTYINTFDNARLAGNMAHWACGGVVPVEPATWGRLKAIYRGN